MLLYFPPFLHSHFCLLLYLYNYSSPQRKHRKTRWLLEESKLTYYLDCKTVEFKHIHSFLFPGIPPNVPAPFNTWKWCAGEHWESK
jgi:hypothetical protein